MKVKRGEKCLNYLFSQIENNQLLLGKLYCGDSSEGHGALGEIREGCSKVTENAKEIFMLSTSDKLLC